MKLKIADKALGGIYYAKIPTSGWLIFKGHPILKKKGVSEHIFIN